MNDDTSIEAIVWGFVGGFAATTGDPVRSTAFERGGGLAPDRPIGTGAKHDE